MKNSIERKNKDDFINNIDMKKLSSQQGMNFYFPLNCYKQF